MEAHAHERRVPGRHVQLVAGAGGVAQEGLLHRVRHVAQLQADVHAGQLVLLVDLVVVRVERGLVPVFNEGNYPGANFSGANEYAAFWTADKVEGEEGKAYYRYIIANQPFISIEKGDTKTFGASVRCVRN